MDNSLLVCGMLLLECIVLKYNYMELEINVNKKDKYVKIILQTKKSA